MLTFSKFMFKFRTLLYESPPAETWLTVYRWPEVEQRPPAISKMTFQMTPKNDNLLKVLFDRQNSTICSYIQNIQKSNMY